jgi:hypothetical protein
MQNHLPFPPLHTGSLLLQAAGIGRILVERNEPPSGQIAFVTQRIAVVHWASVSWLRQDPARGRLHSWMSARPQALLHGILLAVGRLEEKL